MLASSADTFLAVFSMVILALGFLALPVIWFAFFRGKGDEHEHRPPEPR